MEDRLKKFCHIVDCNSFTRAAKALHISQPALSAAVKKLERELGAELIIRSAERAIVLTAAGKVAYAAGKQLTAAAHNLREAITTLRAEKIPLGLGMIDSIAETLLVRERELERLETWAQVSLSINSSATLVQDVHDHTLDVAIIATRAPLPKTIKVTPLGAEPLVVVTHESRRRTMLRNVHQGTLPDFLSYNRGATTEVLVRNAAEAAGVTLEPSFFSTSPEIMLELVLAGRGAAALPYMMVRPFLQDYALARIPLSKKQLVIHRPISAIQESGRSLPDNFAQTLERTTQYLRTLTHDARAI